MKYRQVTPCEACVQSAPIREISGEHGYAATGSVAGVNNVNLGAPTFKYYLASDTTFASPLSRAPASAGNYGVVASYAAITNYMSATASTSFSILSAQQQATLLVGAINKPR